MAKKAKRIQGSGKEKVRLISRTGGYTYYVTIPKEYLKDLGWKEQTAVKVRKSGKKLVVEKA